MGAIADAQQRLLNRRIAALKSEAFEGHLNRIQSLTDVLHPEDVIELRSRENQRHGRTEGLVKDNNSSGGSEGQGGPVR